MQIDLEAIKSLTDEIRQRFEEAQKDGDEMDRGSFGYEEGQVYSHNNLIKIADAFEQLPAIVDALRDAVKNYDIPSIVGDDFIKIQPNHWWVKAKQALKPFTEKQPQP